MHILLVGILEYDLMWKVKGKGVIQQVNLIALKFRSWVNGNRSKDDQNCEGIESA